jgi:hypothetical protein
MVRGALFTLVVISLTACPQPTPMDCSRFLVDTNGNPTGGFGGGPGVGTLTPVAFVGVPVSLTVFAPLSACETDSVRGEIEATGPENEELDARFSEAVTRQPTGTVKTVVTLTPAKVGVHSVRVAFEPSLGARTVLFDVAIDGLSNPSTRVPIPTGENCTVNATWPISDDTVACEERANGYVSLTSSDGGVLRFRGEQLVVVDDVLWSVNGPTTTLERRVYEDGGLRLTDSFPNFPALSTPGMHDVNLALRFRSNGRLTRVRTFADGGSSVAELALDGLSGPPLAYFTEDDDVMFRWSQVDCSFNNCVNLPDLAGLEPGFVWRAERPPFEPGAFLSQIRGFTRPTTFSSSSPKVTLSYDVEPIVTPAYGFERLPLWLGARSTSASDRRVLLSMTDAGLSMSSWPRSVVLRVGRKHVVLSDPDPGYVLVFRK